MIVCPSCGEQTPEGFPRCANCGAALSIVTAARREERKVVTVLFADVVGFTARAERLDPEEVRALQAPYWERIRADLERFGGTVEKFIGDAVMALFGAPTAHEDDPERATRAALAIRDWAREEGGLDVRIGITTGEALVALDARPDAGEGMASGDVVNTAARMQAAAPVNGILVDETTYRATDRVIVFKEAEPVQAKGKAEPVPVFEAVETRARFGVDVADDMATPFVGRQQELDLLVGALARVRAEREPQLVTLVGVPGIGKSRLVWELSQAVDRDPELIFWRQGRSLPYGDGVTYWALSEMAKAQAGILESDSADVAAEKLAHTVRTVMSDPADAEWVERRVRPLVGLAGEDEIAGDYREEAFGAWLRFFETLAERSPLVLVFEDLQWADDGVLDFVDYLAEWASGVPMLVVATARPELLERRPAWGGGKTNAATVQLQALSEEETARLVGALLERAVLPVETQSVLLTRAGGNPLYAQEFVRMLVDRGFLRRDGSSWSIAADQPLPLPESVQGIIAARLDALSAEEKGLLQDAAVLGKVVWTGALAAIAQRQPAVVEEQLHALRRKEFLRFERRSSVAGEKQYAFLHLLMRDVAYGQIPRAARAEKHRLAAEWLESLPSDRTEDRAEMVAHHYLSALELARSSGGDVGGLAERARLALREAGERAFGLNAFGASSRFFAAALDLWPEDDPARPRLLLRLAMAHSYSGGSDETIFEAARDALLDAGDAELAAEAEVLLGLLASDQGDQERALDVMWHAESLVRDRPPSRSKAFVLNWLFRTLALAGQIEAAIELGRETIEMSERLGLQQVLANALSTFGWTRSSTGDARGLPDQQRSIEIARAANSPDVVRSMMNYASCLADMGRIDDARALVAEAKTEADRFGGGWYFAWLEGEAPAYLYYEGGWDEAVRIVGEAVARLEERRTTSFFETLIREVRARIRFARGDTGGALSDGAASVEAARRAKDPQVIYPALAARAALLARLGQVEEAAALMDELQERWRGEVMFAAGFWLNDLALALVLLGRSGELGELLDKVPYETLWVDAARAFGAGDYLEAAAVFGRMASKPDEAYARLCSGVPSEVERALDFFRSVGATRYVEQGEAALAASA
jgi:class 3 adenylate cyclase/tetratricopeptide (TPR) repeat protein